MVLVVFFQRKRKLEVQNGFPCKKLYPEDKTAMLRYDTLAYESWNSHSREQ
jgi:hypothetical protein